jgi:hypothetical protein
VLGVLFAGVTLLRWFIDRSGQAAALLYVVPITLGALRFGRRGAAGTTILGAVAFVVLALVDGQGDLDLTGWSAPLLSMALVGYLAARLAELPRLHAERRSQLEHLCDAQHAALIVSDSIVQQVAAARWMLEAGRPDQAAEVLDATVAEGIAKLSGGISRRKPGDFADQAMAQPGA